MTTLLVILWIIIFVKMIGVLAIRPERSHHSVFELKRLGEEAILRRERLLETVLALRQFMLLLLTSLLAVLAVTAWQWWGVLVMLLVVIVAVPLSRIRIVGMYAMKFYKSIEARLLAVIERWPVLSWLTVEKHHILHDPKLESSEQLLHLVEQAGHILSDDQQRIIKHGLDWHETIISSIMVHRKDIVSIKHSELLGPLVLDDLHKSGHNRFPVIKGDLDTVIGMLDIAELLEVSAGKTSLTAEKAMSPQALRIEADEPLPATLALLQKSRQHMLIVIDAKGKTVGVVTLADITGSLLGKTGVK